MRLILTAAVASLAIATGACSKNNNADADGSTDATLNTDMAMNDMDMNDMNMDHSNMAMPMDAAGFVAAAAATDMYEIESGKLAQSMATMEECKKLGAMLVADHTKSSGELKTAAAAATPPVTVPTAMPAEQKAMLDALKAAKGAAFDKLFIEQQKEAHGKALAMLESYASSGTAPSLKAFAAKTATAVKAHLDMVNSMKM